MDTKRHQTGLQPGKTDRGHVTQEHKATSKQLTGLGMEIYTDKKDNCRFLLVNQAVLSGPLLRCLQSTEERDMTPVLQGWVQNQGGVLPRSVMYTRHFSPKQKKNGQWLTEVYYSLSLLEDLTDSHKLHLYLVRYYIRIPKAGGLVASRDDSTPGNIDINMAKPDFKDRIAEKVYRLLRKQQCAIPATQMALVLNESGESRKSRPSRRLTASCQLTSPRRTGACKSSGAWSDIYRLHIGKGARMRPEEVKRKPLVRTLPVVTAKAARKHISEIMNRSKIAVLNCLITRAGQSGIDLEIAQGHIGAAAAICQEINTTQTVPVWVNIVGVRREGKRLEEGTDNGQTTVTSATRVSEADRQATRNQHNKGYLEIHCMDAVTRSIFTIVRKHEMRLFCSFMSSDYKDRRWSDFLKCADVEQTEVCRLTQSCDGETNIRKTGESKQNKTNPIRIEAKMHTDESLVSDDSAKTAVDEAISRDEDVSSTQEMAGSGDWAETVLHPKNTSDRKGKLAMIRKIWPIGACRPDKYMTKAESSRDDLHRRLQDNGQPISNNPEDLVSSNPPGLDGHTEPLESRRSVFGDRPRPGCFLGCLFGPRGAR